MEKRKQTLHFANFCLGLALIFLFSSCFEVNERLYLRKNGSGTYSFHLDFLKSKTTLDDLVDSYENAPENVTLPPNPLERMEKVLHKGIEKLGAHKGITNEELQFDRQNHHFGLSFSFEDVPTLNNVLQQLGIPENREKQESHYHFKKREFTKVGSSPLVSLLRAIKTENPDASRVNDIIRTALKNATYTFTIETEGTIKKISGSHKSLQSTAREVAVSTTVEELLESANQGINISLKIK